MHCNIWTHCCKVDSIAVSVFVVILVGIGYYFLVDIDKYETSRLVCVFSVRQCCLLLINVHRLLVYCTTLYNVHIVQQDPPVSKHKNHFLVDKIFGLSENWSRFSISGTGNVFFGTPKILKNARKITN